VRCGELCIDIDVRPHPLRSIICGDLASNGTLRLSEICIDISDKKLSSK